MKKHIFSPIILCLLLGACKKGNDYSATQEKFNFKINGVSLKNVSNGKFFSAQPNSYDYLEFNDPANTGNIIRFYSNNCAFSIPEASGVTVTDINNCTFSLNNPPANSSLVYRYQSGTLVSSRSNCSNFIDLFGFLRTTCSISGTFNLTLINNAGQTIIITSGEFFFNSILIM